MASFDDAAALDRLHNVLRRHIRAPSILDERFEDTQAGNSADYAAQQLEGLGLPVRDHLQVDSPNPFYSGDAPLVRFAEGGSAISNIMRRVAAPIKAYHG